jgi:hypothetical protein
MRYCLMHEEQRSSVANRAALAGMTALVLLGVGAASGCGARAPGDDPDGDSSGELSQAASDLQIGAWTQLGGAVNPVTTAPTSRPSLAFDHRSRPLVAFSVHDGAADTDSSTLLGWRGDRWTALGPPLAGGAPSIATDGQDRISICLGTASPAGPFAERWNGSSWSPLGGDVGVETGYRIGRYTWPTCGGMVVDGADAPILAWSAHIGSKADAVYGARWSRRQQKWLGLAPQIDARAMNASIGIDDQDRVYVASFTPGGSYGGGATTRVWRHDGDSWQQLGADLPNTAGPVIAARGSAYAHLALSDRTGTISVKRWRRGAWQDLPSPGSGTNLALDFTPSGRPVLAYVDATRPGLISVKHFAAGAWLALGAGIVAVGTDPPSLDLGVDPGGRVTLASTQGDAATGFTVSVHRYSASPAALP